MNYDLAKELKDAGFPQEGNGSRITQQEDTRIPFKIKGMKEYKEVKFPGKITVDAYFPTLSELVEACGDEFARLSRVGSSWSALMFEERYDGSDEQIGSTPEEAVARLWLALNKKE